MGARMASSDWNCNFASAAETARALHVTEMCGVRPANLAPPVKLTIDELTLKHRASWNGVNMETEWLTANEAAQYLKVKPRTLLQWARERKDSRAPAVRRPALRLEIPKAGAGCYSVLVIR